MPHMDGLSHKLTEAMLAVPDDVQRTVWTHPICQENFERSWKSGNIPGYSQRVKQGRVKVFEYGHRSYKGINPRVPPIQSILKNLDLSADNPLKLAERLERVCPTDAYFKEQGLYVNDADTSNGFYPKIISMAMLAQRIMGIMTHWREYMCKQ
ncbi:hypothetical protein ASPNIDRAFT_126525 [Aspergillus niger ATCC 1015]|uniref:Uncharacterized protein n=1 Tax=Aspergillus niger (strain ATCC 1015 / CBS 113.46 / FGSC A1144 / LSHB Ac4 / NCTC 3858a / NRRL 328 / USDA 3528.7) TaxID=380704 RepID=G3XMQ5_ASPNA|nr:hypothetical protein ASPNIDRAFT_126525 [Aspergillus niger ATCC 1015]